MCLLRHEKKNTDSCGVLLARLKEQRQLLSYKYTLFVFVCFLLFDMLRRFAARFRPIGRN